MIKDTANKEPISNNDKIPELDIIIPDSPLISLTPPVITELDMNLNRLTKQVEISPSMDSLLLQNEYKDITFNMPDILLPSPEIYTKLEAMKEKSPEEDYILKYSNSPSKIESFAPISKDKIRLLLLPKDTNELDNITPVKNTQFPLASRSPGGIYNEYHELGLKIELEEYKLKSGELVSGNLIAQCLELFDSPINDFKAKKQFLTLKLDLIREIEAESKLISSNIEGITTKICLKKNQQIMIPFKFRLPLDLLSSITFSDIAQTKYQIEGVVQVVDGGKIFTYKEKAHFEVDGMLTKSSPIQGISKNTTTSNSWNFMSGNGKVALSAWTDKNVYYSSNDESSKITVRVNNQSGKKLQGLNLSLIGTCIPLIEKQNINSLDIDQRGTFKSLNMMNKKEVEMFSKMTYKKSFEEKEFIYPSGKSTFVTFILPIPPNAKTVTRNELFRIEWNVHISISMGKFKKPLSCQIPIKITSDLALEKLGSISLPRLELKQESFMDYFPLNEALNIMHSDNNLSKYGKYNDTKNENSESEKGYSSFITNSFTTRIKASKSYIDKISKEIFETRESLSAKRSSSNITDLYSRNQQKIPNNYLEKSNSTNEEYVYYKRSKLKQRSPLIKDFISNTNYQILKPSIPRKNNDTPPDINDNSNSTKNREHQTINESNLDTNIKSDIDNKNIASLTDFLKVQIESQSLGISIQEISNKGEDVLLDDMPSLITNGNYSTSLSHDIPHAHQSSHSSTVKMQHGIAVFIPQSYNTLLPITGVQCDPKNVSTDEISDINLIKAYPICRECNRLKKTDMDNNESLNSLKLDANQLDSTDSCNCKESIHERPKTSLNCKLTYTINKEHDQEIKSLPRSQITLLNNPQNRVTDKDLSLCTHKKFYFECQEVRKMKADLSEVVKKGLQLLKKIDSHVEGNIKQLLEQSMNALVELDQFNSQHKCSNCDSEPFLNFISDNILDTEKGLGSENLSPDNGLLRLKVDMINDKVKKGNIKSKNRSNIDQSVSEKVSDSTFSDTNTGDLDDEIFDTSLEILRKVEESTAFLVDLKNKQSPYQIDSNCIDISGSGLLNNTDIMILEHYDKSLGSGMQIVDYENQLLKECFFMSEKNVNEYVKKHSLREKPSDMLLDSSINKLLFSQSGSDQFIAENLNENVYKSEISYDVLCNNPDGFNQSEQKPRHDLSRPLEPMENELGNNIVNLDLGRNIKLKNQPKPNDQPNLYHIFQDISADAIEHEKTNQRNTNSRDTIPTNIPKLEKCLYEHPLIGKSSALENDVIGSGRGVEISGMIEKPIKRQKSIVCDDLSLVPSSDGKAASASHRIRGEIRSFVDRVSQSTPLAEDQVSEMGIGYRQTVSSHSSLRIQGSSDGYLEDSMTSDQIHDDSYKMILDTKYYEKSKVIQGHVDCDYSPGQATVISELDNEPHANHTVFCTSCERTHSGCHYMDETSHKDSVLSPISTVAEPSTSEENIANVSPHDVSVKLLAWYFQAINGPSAHLDGTEYHEEKSAEVVDREKYLRLMESRAKYYSYAFPSDSDESNTINTFQAVSEQEVVASNRNQLKQYIGDNVGTSETTMIHRNHELSLVKSLDLRHNVGVPSLKTLTKKPSVFLADEPDSPISTRMDEVYCKDRSLLMEHTLGSNERNVKEESVEVSTDNDIPGFRDPTIHPNLESHSGKDLASLLAVAYEEHLNSVIETRSIRVVPNTVLSVRLKSVSSFLIEDLDCQTIYQDQSISISEKSGVEIGDELCSLDRTRFTLSKRDVIVKEVDEFEERGLNLRLRNILNRLEKVQSSYLGKSNLSTELISNQYSLADINSNLNLDTVEPEFGVEVTRGRSRGFSYGSVRSSFPGSPGLIASKFTTEEYKDLVTVKSSSRKSSLN